MMMVPRTHLGNEMFCLREPVNVFQICKVLSTPAVAMNAEHISIVRMSDKLTLLILDLIEYWFWVMAGN